MTLGLLILAGASSFFISSKQSFRVQDSAGRMQENARYSMNYLAQTLRIADFWSGVKPAFIAIGTHAATGPRNARNCTGDWIVNVREGLRGYEGGTKSPIDCMNANDYVPHSDMIAIRYADPNAWVTSKDIEADDNADRLYIRARIGAQAYLYQGHRHGEVDSIIPNGNGVLNYEYDFQLLFLRPCSVKAGSACNLKDDDGQPIPTLVSLQLQSDGGVAQVALVDNVEQMQFEYGLDSNNDFAVDSYQIASAITDWQKVIAVRASLIVRGDAIDDFKDDKTYFMSGGFCYGPQSSQCSSKYTGLERYQRRLVVQDILIRNRVRQ